MHLLALLVASLLAPVHVVRQGLSVSSVLVLALFAVGIVQLLSLEVSLLIAIPLMYFVFAFFIFLYNWGMEFVQRKEDERESSDD